MTFFCATRILRVIGRQSIQQSVIIERKPQYESEKDIYLSL